MSSTDAWMFPLIGSAVLFGLFLLFRYFSAEYINMLLSLYFLLFGIGAISSSIEYVSIPLLLFLSGEPAVDASDAAVLFSTISTRGSKRMPTRLPKPRTATLSIDTRSKCTRHSAMVCIKRCVIYLIHRTLSLSESQKSDVSTELMAFGSKRSREARVPMEQY
jgi:hypothetical protein